MARSYGSNCVREFEGRTAVITGGASGIGQALADRFAEARMNIVLADIQEDALAEAVRLLEERQVPVLGVRTDTMVKQAVQNLANESISKFGKIHILCNNAGVANPASAGKAVWELPDGDWDWVMGVNFNGVLYGLQAFVPHMLEHGEPGHIVNTASLAGMLPGGGPYGVSKHGVVSLTEGLQNDLSTRNANINASVLCPGFVDTKIYDAERNRPENLAVSEELSAEATEMVTALAKDMLAKGKTTKEIAEIVFESIKESLFYILPHPAWDDFVRRRVEHWLARDRVASFDPEEMELRRAKGDVF